jgi:hypothetical protein
MADEDEKETDLIPEVSDGEPGEEAETPPAGTPAASPDADKAAGAVADKKPVRARAFRPGGAGGRQQQTGMTQEQYDKWRKGQKRSATIAVAILLTVTLGLAATAVYFVFNPPKKPPSFLITVPPKGRNLQESQTMIDIGDVAALCGKSMKQAEYKMGCIYWRLSGDQLAVFEKTLEGRGDEDPSMLWVAEIDKFLAEMNEVLAEKTKPEERAQWEEFAGCYVVGRLFVKVQRGLKAPKDAESAKNWKSDPDTAEKWLKEAEAINKEWETKIYAKINDGETIDGDLSSEIKKNRDMIDDYWFEVKRLRALKRMEPEGNPVTPPAKKEEQPPAPGPETPPAQEGDRIPG